MTEPIVISEEGYADYAQKRIEALEKALRGIHWFISNKDDAPYYYMTIDNMLDCIGRWTEEALEAE